MADKTLAAWLADPTAMAAALAESPKPIEDSLAIAIAKNPLLVALIAQQLAAAGWNQGSP
jgi:hypothetical protein